MDHVKTVNYDTAPPGLISGTGDGRLPEARSTWGPGNGTVKVKVGGGGLAPSVPAGRNQGTFHLSIL